MKTVHRQPLPPPFEGWEAEFNTVSFAPGSGSAPHRHPGFVLGYVVDGEFQFAINGEAPRVLQAGEAFYEPPGAHHTTAASANPKRNARIVAIVISQKGKEAK